MSAVEGFRVKVNLECFPVDMKRIYMYVNLSKMHHVDDLRKNISAKMNLPATLQLFCNENALLLDDDIRVLRDDDEVKVQCLNQTNSGMNEIVPKSNGVNNEIETTVKKKSHAQPSLTGLPSRIPEQIMTISEEDDQLMDLQFQSPKRKRTRHRKRKQNVMETIETQREDLSFDEVIALCDRSDQRKHIKFYDSDEENAEGKGFNGKEEVKKQRAAESSVQNGNSASDNKRPSISKVIEKRNAEQAVEETLEFIKGRAPNVQYPRKEDHKYFDDCLKELLSQKSSLYKIFLKPRIGNQKMDRGENEHSSATQNHPASTAADIEGNVAPKKGAVENGETLLASSILFPGTTLNALSVSVQNNMLAMSDTSKNTHKICIDEVPTKLSVISQPEERQVLLFNTWKLGSDFTPQISLPICALVLHYDAVSKQVQMRVLHGVEEFATPSGMLTSMDDEEELNMKREVSTIDRREINWNEVLSPLCIANVNI